MNGTMDKLNQGFETNELPEEIVDFSGQGLKLDDEAAGL